jgi:hypothetical protein
MSDNKKLASSTSEHTAELERIEHAKKIVIEVLDKGILDLREVGYLAIDLSGLGRLAQDVVCNGCNQVCNGCNTICAGCHTNCPTPIMPGEIETAGQPGVR